MWLHPSRTSLNPSPLRLPEASPHTCKRSQSRPPFRSRTDCAQRRCTSPNFLPWHCWLWWCCLCVPWRWKTGLGRKSLCRSWARWSPDPVFHQWSTSDTATEQSAMEKYILQLQFNRHYLLVHTFPSMMAAASGRPFSTFARSKRAIMISLKFYCNVPFFGTEMITYL